jgi:hypothetical protein
VLEKPNDGEEVRLLSKALGKEEQGCTRYLWYLIVHVHDRVPGDDGRPRNLEERKRLGQQYTVG